MSIKVVDLQNEEVKEEQPALEPVEEEEAKEEVDTAVVNEVIEETNEPPKAEEPKEEIKVEVKEERKKPVRAQDKIITCPKCNKSMKMKSYRYNHEQNCKGTLEQKPVKKHTNPRPKQTPKPKPTSKPPPEIYYSSDEEEHPTQPLIKKKQPVPVQPINPVDAMAQHYLVLQQQFINQKKEKYNNLCMNMFSSKTKKR